MAKRKATILECDNPDCDSWVVVDEATPALGYHFDGGGKYAKRHVGVVHWMGGGRPIRSFYACSSVCIVPAMNARIEEEDR